MKVKSNPDIDKNFDLILKESAEVEFWRAEYIKRLFYKENDYEKMLSRYLELIKRWKLFVDKFEIPQMEREFSLHKFLYGFRRDIGRNSTFEVSNNNKIYIDFSLKYDVDNFGIDLHRVCSLYGFYFDDLINRTDMSQLLKKEEIIIPLPPDRYWYKDHYHPTFSQEVLTLMTQDPHTPTLINYIGDEWRQAHREFEYSPHDMLFSPGANLLSLDFVISGKSIHKNFDLDIAMNEINDFLTWNVYVLKKKFGIPLKDNEKIAIIKLYRRMIAGKYREKYVAARAIGLWLWDEVQNKNCSISHAIRSYEAQGFFSHVTTDDERTFRRWHEKTNDCIENGEVLSLIKSAGKNKKTAKV